MNNKLKRKIASASAAAVICAVFSACGDAYSDRSAYARTGAMTPIGAYNASETKEYTDEGIKEEIISSFSSDDGLCRIDVYPSYYGVTLDFEKGERKAVGKAYAEAILKAAPGLPEKFEPYIYENINLAFSGRGKMDYGGIEKRLNALYENIPEEYKEEISGFAEKISAGERGFVPNGKISCEEALIMQMIPDAVRPTSCSALSLWGEKTVSGKAMTLRCLEWQLGSENQIGYLNAVVHMKNGEKSLTAISYLGMFDIISAINDDGVFAAILDAGAGEELVYEGKKCYTHELRYALENFSTAKEVGTYMNEKSGDFTFCHNLCITDGNESYQAEDCTKEVAEKGLGFTNLRDENTPIMEGLTWDNPDSLCIVNSFTSAGNLDNFTGSLSNAVRFRKYNDFVSAREKFSPKDIKDMITTEDINQYKVDTVHSQSAAQIIIIDYDAKNIQVAFSGKDGALNKPDFIDVGGYND